MPTKSVVKAKKLDNQRFPLEYLEPPLPLDHPNLFGALRKMFWTYFTVKQRAQVLEFFSRGHYMTMDLKYNQVDETRRLKIIENTAGPEAFWRALVFASRIIVLERRPS